MLSINQINEIKFEAAAEYEKNIAVMLEELNSRMLKFNEEFDLIGDNPVSVMIQNHENHATFMTNVFKLNDFEMLKNTLVWVVESYMARGFKADYFQYQLNNWIDIINKYLIPNYSVEIIKVYEFIKGEVKRIEEAKKMEIYGEYPFDDNWLSMKEEFTKLLLDGRYYEVLSFTRELVSDKESLEEFYVKVVTYSMYEIGEMWQDGRITVAQEHHASSTVVSVMGAIYQEFILAYPNKGKAVVLSAYNEQHEVGARIVSDMLELDGWDVKYLGGNIPNEELLKCIKSEKPLFIAISVTMTYNLNNVKLLIEKIKSDDEIKETKILLGGLAFNYGSDDLDLGADIIVKDIDETIKIAREWWENY